MRFKISGNSYLNIKQEAIDTFGRFLQQPGMNESGGILIGRCFIDRIEIEFASTPNKTDKAGPTFFIRAKKPAQMLIDEFWKKSNGEQIYLGEWHTHSVVNPRPSQDDKSMIKDMLRTSKLEIDFLLILIIGNTGNIWVGRIDGKGLSQPGSFNASKE